MIYVIEGKASMLPDWVRGDARYSHRERAEEAMDALVSAFAKFAPWPMEFRVIELEGNILDGIFEKQHGVPSPHHALNKEV